VGPRHGGSAASHYSWSNARIDGGGFVPGIVFSRAERGLVYARTDIGGAYRRDRHDRHWVPLLDHVGWEDWNRNGVLSLAPDPGDPDRVYAAVGMYTNESDPHHGAILRSDDRGDSWHATPLPFKVGGNMPGRGIGERLAVDPSDGRVLYFGAEGGNGLWRSKDRGHRWKCVDAFPNVGDFAPDPDSDNSYETQQVGVLFTLFDPRTAGHRHRKRRHGACRTLFTAVADPQHVLYRSDDAGQSWEAVPEAPTGYIPHKGVIDEHGGFLYLATSDTAGPYDGGDGQVWRYGIDDGTWTEITPRQRPTDTDFGFSGLSLDRNHPDTLVVASQVLWSPDVMLFRSTDRGEHWTPLWDYVKGNDGTQTFRTYYEQDASDVPWLTFGAKPTKPGVGVDPAPKLGWMTESVEIDPFDPDHALYGTGATVYSMSNLQAWGRRASAHHRSRVHVRPDARGIEETAIQDLAAPEGKVDLLSAMLDLGGFVHRDVRKAPAMIEGPYLGGSTSVDVAGVAQRVFVRAGTANDGKHRTALSRDAGGSWTSGTPVRGTTDSGHVALTADGKRIVWSAPGIGVQVSDDDGKTWTSTKGLPAAVDKAGALVAADRVDPDRICLWANNRLYVSADGGKNATAVDSDVLPVDGQVRLAAVPGREHEVWLAGGSGDKGSYGLFRSTDAGATWTALTGFDAADTVGFGKPARGTGHPTVFTSASRDGTRGFFRSTDVGRTWHRINDDWHQYGRTDGAIIGDPDVFGRVYVATNGRGIVIGDTDE
jgi:xyloglucan-specific exo-beta-1,4-glucanase